MGKGNESKRVKERQGDSESECVCAFVCVHVRVCACCVGVRMREKTWDHSDMAGLHPLVLTDAEDSRSDM